MVLDLKMKRRGWQGISEGSWVCKDLQNQGVDNPGGQFIGGESDQKSAGWRFKSVRGL